MKYKKGKFVKYREGILLITEDLKNDSDDFTAFGFGGYGSWGGISCGWAKKLWKEATREEWFEALKNYANEKGYPNGGYKCLHDPDDTYPIGTKKEYMLSSDGTELWYDANLIMQDGVWAEITKDEPTETRTKLDEVVELLNKAIEILKS